MQSKLSVLWWKVHHLKNASQAARIVSHIKERNPDIFALGGVVGEAAYRLIAKEFPEHNFYMTFGKQAQEMLVGVKRTMQAFFSQRTEFQSGNEFLRPAALLTISLGELPLNLLFVHVKSFSDPLSLGYRDNFIKRLGRLKATLDNLSGGSSRFVVCGDFNLRGMFYLERSYIKPEDEFHHIQNELGDIGILFAEPSSLSTWSSKEGRSQATLDYVAATDSTNFANLGNDQGQIQLRLGGWPEYPRGTFERNEFIEAVSDHASVYFEIIV